jgi:mannose-6-phosphate isomerase-like protein (cupin superfamily)
MFSSRITTSRVPVQSIKRIASTQLTRQLSTTRAKMGKDSKMPSGPPKHQMIYFPGLTSEVRAFGQFRKVMHTGLFSQIVSMEIPVGGDIGNEVHLVDQVLIFTSGEGKATVAGKDQVRNNLVYFSIRC